MVEIVEFLNRGGIALWLIALLFFLLWIVVFRHYAFVFLQSKKLADHYQDAFKSLQAYKNERRKMIISNAKKAFFGDLVVLKTVVKIAPLLGLLGTVMGMIEVFDTLSFFGTGDPRLMAGGIARATLPTMAGMVVAILGIFFVSRIENFAQTELEKLKERLI